MDDGPPTATTPWREARYRRFYEVVDEIVAELQDLPGEDGKPRRRLGGDKLIKLRHSVETLIRDSVAVTMGRQRTGETAIHLSPRGYGPGTPDPQLTYNIHVQRAYKGMIRLGYLEEVRRGFFDRSADGSGQSRGRLTRYVATDKLIDRLAEDDRRVLPAIVPPRIVELVQVKIKGQDGRRHRLPVEKTPEVERMAANIDQINRVLLNSWFDLELPDGEIISLQEAMEEDEEGDKQPLDLSRRTLYRVFNDPDLKTGGRFYGGWWQSIRNRDFPYRSKLIVNGKRMVEYDYSNLHPTILYAREGEVPPEDSYAAVIDYVKAVSFSQGGSLRKVIKKAFNAMLNAEKPLSRPPKDIELQRFELTWAELSEAIRRCHAPIAHHFETGVGVRLQRLDSDIAEKVLLYFAKGGIPVLPVHDSFLAHHGYSELPKVMARAFEEIVGVSPRIDQKHLTEPSETEQAEWSGDPYDFGEPTTDDLVEILRELDVGHERRLEAFRRGDG
jgi:hypothetical protein